MSHLKELLQFNQSPWYDSLRRSLLTSGELRRMIEEDGLRGITSNPTIFEKAIIGSTDYNQALDRWASEGEREAQKIYESLAVEDIQKAADILRSQYDETQGRDGFVSLEVSPFLAHDTVGTVAEARRLAKQVNRVNAMIKVPATLEGVPAIEQLTSEGLNINVTLIFSVDRYDAVANAYLAGLEKRVRSGQPISQVASVASFFVSRIDTAIDKILEEKILKEKTPGDRAALESLLGKAAIANTKMAYKKFKEIFSSARFHLLCKKRAQVQRPLWASTGTKNPHYGDVFYVESLIAPDTVSTIPPETWTAFRNHGTARASLEENIAEAEAVLSRLNSVGIDLSQVTASLETAGVKAFADSFSALMRGITTKMEAQTCKSV